MNSAAGSRPRSPQCAAARQPQCPAQFVGVLDDDLRGPIAAFGRSGSGARIACGSQRPAGERRRSARCRTRKRRGSPRARARRLPCRPVDAPRSAPGSRCPSRPCEQIDRASARRGSPQRGWPSGLRQMRQSCKDCSDGTAPSSSAGERRSLWPCSSRFSELRQRVVRQLFRSSAF